MAGPDALDKAVAEFSAAFDRRRGGFGNAPKFPRPSELTFLLREHARTGAAEPRDMALLTLRAMALGGMRDHLGGGFHRYSVDGDWRVPHFEKMLYDQAQLVHAYVDAAQLTGDPQYADVATDTMRYVRRDLTDPDGGFYSAEDADSIPPEHAGDPGAHKMEGAFYIWSHAEVRRLLGERAEPFCRRYGVLEDGNAPFDPQNEFTGQEPAVRGAVARGRGGGHRPQRAGRCAPSWRRHARSLFTARLQPPAAAPRRQGADRLERPDDWRLRPGGPHPRRRVLGGGCRARRPLPAHPACGTPRPRRCCAATVASTPRLPGYAEDYAYLASGLLELFQATGDPAWLEWAITLHRRLDDLFADPVEGGWFSTTGEDASVLLRLKEQYDGAEPAATSVAALNLLALAHLTGDSAMTTRAEAAIGSFRAQLGRAVPLMLTALSTYHAGSPAGGHRRRRGGRRHRGAERRRWAGSTCRRRSWCR